MGSRRALATVAAAVLAATLVGCGSSGTSSERPTATPVVVDTDLSFDDAIALLYLLRSPSIDIRAVTVAGTGLVHCPAGARNALQLLALGGRLDVPVACGRGTPLAGVNAPPEDWRKSADGLFGLELPPAAAKPERDAIALLRREAPNATVLELAPMTNLAGALRAEPALAGQIHRVVAMGGALSVPGNVDQAPTAETNAWVDPTAMRIVLRSGVPLTLVPLDATNQVPVTPYVGETMKRYHYATPEATAVWDLLWSTGMVNGGSYFWDPLAAVSLVDPGVLATAERRIDVLTGGGDPGRTVVSGTGTRTTVATDANRVRFERDLLGTLLGSTRFTISRRPTAAVRWNGETCSWDGPSSLTEGTVVIDGVDTADRPFQVVIVSVKPPHTLADLGAYVTGLTGPPTKPPAWIEGQSIGTVQPRSTMSWSAYAASPTSGSVVVACVTSAPPYVSLAASLPVYAR